MFAPGTVSVQPKIHLVFASQGSDYLTALENATAVISPLVRMKENVWQLGIVSARMSEEAKRASFSVQAASQSVMEREYVMSLLIVSVPSCTKVWSVSALLSGYSL